MFDSFWDNNRSSQVRGLYNNKEPETMISDRECEHMLDLCRMSLYKEMKSYASYFIENDKTGDLNEILIKPVKNLTDHDKCVLIMEWINRYSDVSKDILKDFTDEDILYEINRRIENGTIVPSTKLHLTNKGSVN